MKNLLLVALASLLIGAAGGWAIHGWYVGAGETAQAKEAVQSTAVAIVESNDASQATEKKVEEVTAPVKAARTAIQQHLKQRRVIAAAEPQEKAHEAVCQPTGPIVVGDVPVVLDQRTVRLLDAARGGVAEPAPGSDGAGKAPSDVAVEEFIDNDGQVVEQYKDLAARHDALVDWAERELRKQAGQQ
ncbi:hypothetical protein [Cupriavidus campinensis]|uniref:Uncharacterized protein n=1 Tax=Cupriavidus campinensis TaxID=151783 RepID=A0ABY3ESU2_9BURK|nr:hypothetical protein [Cupriavidus campinensis]TSP13970.1 hypothetical protein FGG12_05725 [Cupriavidus campinensis]